VYAIHGITLPRDADAQALDGGGRRVDLDDLLPGDLVFYRGRAGRKLIAHVTMYAGDGQMIEARTRDAVRFSALRTSGLWGAVRYLP
jgi:gamma-D-glutamyl-L-lysine dipeptidyl-peptidase